MNCFICACKLSEEMPFDFCSIFDLYCKNCDTFYYFYDNTIFVKKFIEINSIIVELSIHLRGKKASIYIYQVKTKYNFRTPHGVINELYEEKCPITLDVYDDNNYIKELNFYYNKSLKYLDNLIFI
jgi:hypothetical protein